MESAENSSPELRGPIAAVLTWLLPGLGHIFIGERVRGTILLVTIAVTFWTGVAVGGVGDAVNPGKRRLWFAAQICAGGHTLGALAWRSAYLDEHGNAPAPMIAYGREEEIAVVYTAICGMLNILIVFDVLNRAERRPAPVEQPKQPRKGREAPG